jgi:nucleotide-binding universal stress UspA family protein
MDGPKRILVATDFSEQAGRALDAALALGERTKAEVHLIHALEVALPLFEPYAVVLPADWIGEARRLAQQKLEKAQATVKARGLGGSIHLGDVPAAHAIADRAARSAPTWLMARTGHGPRHVRSAAWRSNCQYAPCAVTVKGEAAASPRRSWSATTSEAGARPEVAAEWARCRRRLHVCTRCRSRCR